MKIKLFFKYIIIFLLFNSNVFAQTNNISIVFNTLETIKYKSDGTTEITKEKLNCSFTSNIDDIGKYLSICMAGTFSIINEYEDIVNKIKIFEVSCGYCNNNNISFIFKLYDLEDNKYLLKISNLSDTYIRIYEQKYCK